MKPKLTLLFTLLYLAAFPQTGWAPIGAEWYFSRLEGTSPPDQGYTLYEVVKDTAIQNKAVRVVSKTYYHFNGHDVFNMGEEYTYEENGVVYYWKNGQFYTLYNFNALPGDKWTVYGQSGYSDFCGYDTLGVIVVDSVSTVTINNQELKALYTSPDSTSNWGFNKVILEQVGCTEHLLPQAKECAVDIPTENGPLRCYEDTTIGLYVSNYWESFNYDCDHLFDYTSVDKIESGSVSFYPNPVKNYLNIQYSNNFSPDGTCIEIYDMNGVTRN